MKKCTTTPEAPTRFDRRGLELRPLSERIHDLDLSVILDPAADGAAHDASIPEFKAVAGAMMTARKEGASIILMMGAHVIRSGVQRYLIDLMSRGYISCMAVNGAAMIHDYEFALTGATTESVARYIRTGQFGLWRETGHLNDVINDAYRKDAAMGMGEAVGEVIASGGFPNDRISLLAAGYRLNVPVTVHVGIGYDIIHEHPNFDAAATGTLSYNDFLRFASKVDGLEHGVVLSFGSAVMAPEVFLKALSMVRNVAHRNGRRIHRFTTLVTDLADLPPRSSGEPPQDTPGYYFRPWKTLLVRTVEGGGTSFYVKGMHHRTIPALWAEVNEAEKEAAI